MYALTTHCRLFSEKSSAVRIDGSATFTIETSRITMNCAAQAISRISPVWVGRREAGTAPG